LHAIGLDPRCDGFSGADLASLVREAAVGALRQMRHAPAGTPVVMLEHFDAALDVVRPSVSAKDEAGYKSLASKLRRRRNTDKPAPARRAGEAGPALPEPGGEDPCVA
jgi:ribosome biogenesis ATPase